MAGGAFWLPHQQISPIAAVGQDRPMMSVEAGATPLRAVSRPNPTCVEASLPRMRQFCESAIG
jgi:hypothetical protein